MKVAALMFHHIGPRREGTHSELTVTPERFRRMLTALRRSGHVGIAAREWRPQYEAGTDGRRRVILTFDDAYADLMPFALPVLVELGYRATVFAVGGAIGRTNAWDAADGAAGHGLMSENDLRAWSAQGCEVGAHGMTHVDLTGLGDEDLATEVEEPQRVLGRLVDGEVTSFAYPYGSYDERVCAAVLRTYRVAFGIEEGRNGPSADRSRLRRTMVQPADTALDALLRARLGWSPAPRARAALRPRSRFSVLAGRRRG